MQCDYAMVIIPCREEAPIEDEFYRDRRKNLILRESHSIDASLDISL